jgi:hypothetical protein
LQLLKLVDTIYTTVIKTFYNRFYYPYQSQVLPNTQLQAFNKRLQNSQRYKVYQSGNGIYQVEYPDTGIKYIVDLPKKTCEYTNFQEYKSLYIYRIAACKYASLDPFKKFSVYHKLRVYRDTYSRFLQPVSIQDLESDPNIHPPIIRKQRGRPKSKQIQKGADKRKPKTCSTYRKKARHDKQTCQGQPVQNGRRQQAWDREIHSSSDSVSPVQNRQRRRDFKIEDSLSDSPTSNVEVDDQFSVEMALYDRRMAQGFLAAQRIEAIKASELMDSIVEGRSTVDSDSELSTMSSSRFSGLDKDWWKEKAPAIGGIQASAATVTVVRTRSRSKQVHWE